MKYTRYYADESGASRTEGIDVDMLSRDFATPPAAAPFPHSGGRPDSAAGLTEQLKAGGGGMTIGSVNGGITTRQRICGPHAGVLIA